MQTCKNILLIWKIIQNTIKAILCSFKRHFTLQWKYDMLLCVITYFTLITFRRSDSVKLRRKRSENLRSVKELLRLSSRANDLYGCLLIIKTTKSYHFLLFSLCLTWHDDNLRRKDRLKYKRNYWQNNLSSDCVK